MIRLEIPSLPPSSNKAYFNMRGKGRALTTEGRAYLTATKEHLVRRYPNEMCIFAPNKPYFIAIRFFFESVENSGFTKGKADARYKHFDGGNRTKLLEDALKDAGGIDDSQTMASFWEKKQGTPERTVLWVWSLEDERTPFDDVLRQLP